jgi:hypothetical protein
LFVDYDLWLICSQETAAKNIGPMTGGEKYEGFFDDLLSENIHGG